MKSYLSKLGVLLIGAMFAVSGCQDYDEDIRKVNEKVDTNVSQIGDVTDALDKAIKDLTATHATDKAALEGALASLKTELQGEIDSDINAAVKKLEDALDKDLKALEDGYKADDAKLAEGLRKEAADALTTAVAALKNELKPLIDANKEANAKTSADLTAFINEVNPKIQSLEKAVEDLKDLPERVGNLESDLAAKYAELVKADAKTLADAKAYTDGIKAALETTIATLEDRVDENEERIDELEDAAKFLLEQIQAEAKAREDGDAELAGKIAAEATARAQAIEAVYVAMAAQKTELVDSIKIVKAALQAETDARILADEQLEGKLDDAKEQLQEAIDANSDKIDALTTRVESLEDRVAQNAINISKNTEAIEALQETADELDEKITAAIKKAEDELAAFELEVANTYATIEDVEDLEGKLDQEVDNLETMITNEVAALYVAIEEEVDLLEQQLDLLLGALEVVEDQVVALLSRVQKIVYLPDFADGKATINYAQIGTEVIEGQSVLKYMVYPAELAQAVADSLQYVSFDVQGVTTRATDPVINIVEAEAANGVVTFTVQARNLADEFYLEPGVSGKKSHSIALLLSNGNDNYSTEYTNLLPNKTGDITFTLLDASDADIDTKTTDAEAVQKISYTDTTTVKTSLAGHHLLFDSPEETGMTYEEFLALGYEAELKSTYSAVNTDDLFIVSEAVNEDTELNEVSVKINKAEIDPANVGKKINVVYTYELAGLIRSAGSLVEIDKENLKFELPAQTATWTYLLDVNADAYLFNSALPAATYNRTFEGLQDDVDNALSGITLADLESMTPSDLKVYEVDGTNKTEVLTPSVAFTYDATENSADVEVVDFDMQAEKTYMAEAVYELTSSRVTVEFSFNAVDREREAVAMVLPAQSFNFVKDLVADGDDCSISSVVDTLKKYGNLDADAVAADYCDDAFVTNAPTMSDRKVAAGATALVTDASAATGINFKSADFSTLLASFDFADFAGEIPTAMTAAAKITTWYGQEVEFTQDIALVLPKYDFKHSKVYVTNSAGLNDFYSQVKGQYTDSGANIDLNTPDLANFSVAKVDMDAAFNVVNADDEIVSATDRATAGLQTAFELEGTHGAGITMTGNLITYDDIDEFVNVTGRLNIVNTNASYVVLPTRFGAPDVNGVHYMDYIVKKLNPIGELVATDAVCPILNPMVYEVPILKYFALKENRVGALKNYDLIDNTTFAWTVGDGANGFASGLTGYEIYGLTFEWGSVEIPAEYTDRISYDDVNKKIVFDATPTLSIFEDIVIPVTLTVNHKWGSTTNTVNVTFPKNAE